MENGSWFDMMDAMECDEKERLFICFSPSLYSFYGGKRKKTRGWTTFRKGFPVTGPGTNETSVNALRRSVVIKCWEMICWRYIGGYSNEGSVHLLVLA